MNISSVLGNRVSSPETPLHAKRPRRAAWALLAAAALLLQACAIAPQALRLDHSLSADCQQWWATLDSAVGLAGMADAEAQRIPGFPGLRSTRQLDALRSEAARSPAAMEAWLQHAARADASARRAEISNLPASSFPLAGAPVREAAHAITLKCSQQGIDRVRADSELQASLLQRAGVPQRYSLVSRTLGLYPLLRWPFFDGVQRWQTQHEADMQRWRSQPPPVELWLPEEAARPDLMPSARDALGLPAWSDDQVSRWLAAHAPVFAVESRGAFDRFGAPQWRSATAEAPVVRTDDPVVYQRFTATRLAGRWLPQLVYTVWFPERPARSSLDPLAGALDGLIVRLTLSESGDVLLLDTIHACGCYHLFFASSQLKERPGAPRLEEWLFAPAPLPAAQPSERLVVHISSAEHQVMAVTAGPLQTLASAPPSPSVIQVQRYRSENEQLLRALPPQPPQANSRSLYAPDGLVPGTQRGERWFFWPMGIASAGAMRQWGHHATAFVGRRHFDDPDLLEERFEYRP